MYTCITYIHTNFVGQTRDGPHADCAADMMLLMTGRFDVVVYAVLVSTTECITHNIGNGSVIGDFLETGLNCLDTGSHFFEVDAVAQAVAVCGALTHRHSLRGHLW